MADFEAPTTSSTLSPVDSLDTSSELTHTDDLVMFVERIAAAIRPATEPLAHLEQLEKAVAHEWLLTSADVKRVIGVKPKGNSFTLRQFYIYPLWNDWQSNRMASCQIYCCQ